MDINIIAPGHPNQDKMRSYYTAQLTKRYGKLDWIVSLELRVKENELGDYELSLTIDPDMGSKMYAKASHAKQDWAFKEVIKKLNPQIEKHKGIHYSSERR